MTEIQVDKRCSSCGLVKAGSEFPRNRAQRDGLGSTCKPCKAAARILRQSSRRILRQSAVAAKGLSIQARAGRGCTALRHANAPSPERAGMQKILNG